MAKNGMLFLATLVVVIAFNEVNALKCYRCSSDATNSQFCADTFEPEKLTDAQRTASYVDCSEQRGTPVNIPINTRSVCKKLKQRVNDKIVVSRSCFWEDINDRKDECKSTPTASYIKTEFCETCHTDGCNGASEYGPIAAFVLIPAAIARILTL